MNAFKILLTDKLLGTCSLGRPTQNRLLAISCRVREGGGGGLFVWRRENPDEYSY